MSVSKKINSTHIATLQVIKGHPPPPKKKIKIPASPEGLLGETGDFLVLIHILKKNFVLDFLKRKCLYELAI